MIKIIPSADLLNFLCFNNDGASRADKAFIKDLILPIQLYNKGTI